MDPASAPTEVQPPPPPQPANAPVSAAQAAAKWAAAQYAAGKGGRLQVTISTGAYWSGRIIEQGAEYITLHTWDGFVLWIPTYAIVAITPSSV